MKTPKHVIFLGMAVLLWAAPLFAQSGIPDLSNCEAWLAYEGPEVLTLMVRPDGQGSAFTEAQLPDGTHVDGTLFVKVIDWGEEPVVNFPAEDLWIESEDGGLVACLGGTIADVNTDETGLSYWIEPLQAGGSSLGSAAVFVSGDSWGTGDLPLNFNSPDLTGDGVVNLADLAYFSEIYYEDYDFRADLYRDGVINLSDVALMAQGWGVACP
jgi:hypothetical protein|nr:hypothetical protein [Candidatus Krumholzibacteria bacterium]